jgi:parallel beta-helix repeat protein
MVVFFIIVMVWPPIAPTVKADLSNPSALKDHGVVDIKSNAEFVAMNGVVAGQGTPTNPYIIENWTFSSNISMIFQIKNTDAYYIVRNCLFIGSSKHNNPGVGIWLTRTSHGLYINNRFDTNSLGLIMENTNNTTVKDNLFINNGQAFHAQGPNDYISVIHNRFINNDYGIMCQFSHNSIIKDNTLTGNGAKDGWGIGVRYSRDSVLYNNVVTDFNYDLLIASNKKYGFNLTIPQNNTVHGKPVILLKNASNLAFPSNAGFIGILNCSHITVQGFVMANVSPAVLIVDGSDNITVHNNEFYNVDTGTYAVDSKDIDISDNNIHNISTVLETYDNADNIVINRNNISSPSYIMLLLHNGNKNTFTNNTVKGVGWWVGRFEMMRNLTIRDNNITAHTDSYGFSVLGGENVTFQRNKLDTARWGITMVWDTAHIRILDNQISNINGSSISVSPTIQSNDTVIQNNTIMNNLKIGIDTSGSARNITVLDNKLMNSSLYGFKIGGNGTRARGNMISGNIYGIYFNSPTNANISQNTIFNNSIGVGSTCTPTPGNATVFDNIFKDNNKDYDSLDAKCHINWSITPFKATSIVGGPYQGGNFWDKYPGTDQDGDFLGDNMLPWGPGDKHPLIPIAPIIEDRTRLPRHGQPLYLDFAIDNTWGITNVSLETWQDNGAHDNHTLLLDHVAGKWSFYGQDINISKTSSKLNYIVKATNKWSKTTTFMKLNISIVDGTPPAVTDISGSPRLNENFTIRAQIVDKFKIISVPCTYWIDNGNHTKTLLSQEGISNYYSVTIYIPPIAFNLSYILAATDEDWNRVILLETLVPIIDPIPPILNVTAGIPTTGDNFTLNITAKDNIRIVSRSLTYWSDSGTRNETLWSEPNFNLTVPISAYVLHIIANATDLWGNVNGTRLDLNVVDNDAPVIEVGDMFPATGLDFSLQANVTDNWNVGSANVNYSFFPGNWTQSPMIIDGITAAATIHVPDNATEFHYSVWTGDTSGNWANASGFSTVRDIIKPYFQFPDDPLVAKTGVPLQIGGQCHDNVLIKTATIETWQDTEAHKNVTYSGLVDLNVYESSSTAHIIIMCVDSSMNIGVEKRDLNVTDIIPPTLNDMTKGKPSVGSKFTIHAYAHDNRGLRSVNVTYWLGKKMFQGNMTYQDSEYLFTVKIASGAKTFRYSIIALDLAGNINSTVERKISIKSPGIFAGMNLVHVLIIVVVMCSAVGGVCAFIFMRRRKKAVTVQPAPQSGPQQPIYSTPPEGPPQQPQAYGVLQEWPPPPPGQN